MGFLSKITGFDDHIAATNILLAEYAYFDFTAEKKYSVLQEIVSVQKEIKGRAAGELRDILADLDRQPRTVQMQFIALACRNLGISPGINSFDFHVVENPYRAKSITDQKIQDTARAMFRAKPNSFSSPLPWSGWDLNICFTRIAQTKGASDQWP